MPSYFDPTINSHEKYNMTGDSKARKLLSPLEEAGKYMAREATKDEEDYQHLHSKMNKVEAVMSLATVNFVNTQDSHFYNRAIQEGMGVNCISTQANEAMNTMLSAGLVGVDKTGQSIRLSADSLKAGDLDALRATGTLHIKGITYSVYGKSEADVREIMSNAHAETLHNQKFSAALTHHSRIEAVKEMRSTNLQVLKTQHNIDLGSGTHREIAAVRNQLQKKVDDARKIGDLQAMRNASADLALVDKHASLLGSPQSSRKEKQLKQNANTLRAQHGQAFRMIGESILGQDMMVGINMIDKTAKVTAAGVRLAWNGGDKLTYKITESLAKKGNVTAEKIHSAQDKHRAKKDAKNKAKYGTAEERKEYKLNKRKEKAEKRLNKEKTKDAKFNQKQKDLRNSGRDKTANRRDKRQNTRKKLKERGARIKGWFIPSEKGMKIFAVCRNVIAAPFKFLNFINPLRLLNILTGLIKKYIIAPLAIALAALIVLIIILQNFGGLMTVSMNFLTGTNFVEGLKNLNYGQIIVDDVTETLGQAFLEVAKEDAENHFVAEGLDDNSTVLKNNDIAWKKAVTNGEIRDIISTADNRKLDSVNANLLPIMSVMKTRYYDYLTYEHWQTARGYVYYMYVQTHRVGDYDYKDADDCPNNMLYANEPNINWGSLESSPDEFTLLRNVDELCTNVYVHGYDKNLSKMVNQARAAGSNALNVAIKFLKLDDKIAIDTSTYGAFDYIPYDTIDGQTFFCDNYREFQRGRREGTDSSLDHIDNICGIIEHIHNKNCYGITCGKEAHTHGYGCNHNNCTHTHDYTCCAIINPRHYHGAPHFPCNTANCTHTHDASCCSKEVHTHSAGPSDNFTSTSPNPYYSDCWSLTCTTDVHVHDEWHSSTDPGCWKTKYVCQGHCGGHIIPQIDIHVDMTFEDIVKHDSFKTAYLLKDADFENEKSAKSFIDDLFDKRTIDEWKDYWNEKMAYWWIPFPHSPKAIVQTYYDYCKMNWAKMIDGISGIGEKWFYADKTSEPTDADIDAQINNEANKDYFNFKGWYLEDGTLDKTTISHLYGLNGTYEDNYSEGSTYWEEMGGENEGVVFPVGYSRPYLGSQISDTVKYLQNQGYYSESQIEMVKDAMKMTGQYWFDQSSVSTSPTETSGRSNPEDFVKKFLYRNFGLELNWTAKDFIEKSSRPDYINFTTLPYGTVIIRNNNVWNVGKGWDTAGIQNTPNEYLIYLGLFEEGVNPDIDGLNEQGFYFLTCDAERGGSIIIRLTDNELTKYTRYFKPVQ